MLSLVDKINFNGQEQFTELIDITNSKPMSNAHVVLRHYKIGIFHCWLNNK